MHHRYLIALPLLGIASVAVADDYRCTQEDLVRRIEVVYEPGRAVPCEVHYYKDTEAPDSPEMLWRAENEAGYCEARAAGLAERLSGFGWSCSAAAQDSDADSDEQADDTDALAPAEDDNGDG